MAAKPLKKIQIMTAYPTARINARTIQKKPNPENVVVEYLIPIQIAMVFPIVMMSAQRVFLIRSVIHATMMRMMMANTTSQMAALSILIKQTLDTAAAITRKLTGMGTAHRIVWISALKIPKRQHLVNVDVVNQIVIRIRMAPQIALINAPKIQIRLNPVIVAVVSQKRTLTLTGMEFLIALMVAQLIQPKHLQRSVAVVCQKPILMGMAPQIVSIIVNMIH
jgi:hypothetical protein